MTLRLFTTIAAVGLLAAGMPANAVPADNAQLADPPGVYYGNGNQFDNVGWVVDNEAASTESLEIGLDTITRYVGPVSPTTGNVYNVGVGNTTVPNKSGPLWGFGFSANGTGGLLLSGYNLSLTIADSVTGSTITIDPKTISDNGGTNGTLAGSVGGTDGCSALGAGSNPGCNPLTQTGIQNAENMSFPIAGDPLYNPWIADTFTITLSATGLAGNSLGSVTEVINAVPEPASMALLGSAVAWLGFLRRRRAKATNKA
jgi:hypothetical protein